MLDYKELFEDQPEDVKSQLPENFRAQLEEGTDALIIDEEELTGEYPGGEILRVRAVDFRQESEDPETFSCRLELTGLLYPEWDDEGPVEDGEGNRFFSLLTSFRTPEGERNDNLNPIPGEEDSWLKGFKSYRIHIEDMLDCEMVDKSTYQYLNDRAKAWVACIEENDGDTQAPYTAEDEEGKGALGTLMGYLSCTYMDFQLDIRPILQYGSVERYGIHNINVERYGLKKLNQTEKVSSRQERLSKKGSPQKAPQKSPTSKGNKQEPKSNQSSGKSFRRRR